MQVIPADSQNNFHNMQIAENKTITFFKEARVELAKVAWPSRQTIIKHTLIVIAVSLVLAAFLGMLDIGFAYVIQNFVL
ncbi:MAG: hypothetical protein ACD_63C00150G0002 [uncultured bacterium]|nr:MAG: hypothetical protein ACD_63C00150G0002 [uncultured bacterium]